MSIICENEVYVQNSVNASMRLPMSNWNFGRITSLNGERVDSTRNTITQKQSVVRNWWMCMITGNIVEAQPSCSDMTQCEAAAVSTMACRINPGPEMFFNFSRLDSTLFGSSSAS